jgi:hypothetical protein
LRRAGDTLQRRNDALNAREKKTATELETMIMDEVRKHPDLSDVLNVSVGENPVPGPPNWRPMFGMGGARSCPQKAFDIATKLGRIFDRA